MTITMRKLISPIIALAGFGLSSKVFAGASVGSIVYGTGDSTAVPTLGGSALIVLAVLLAVVAFRILRTQQHKGVNLVVALTAITAIAAGAGGIRLVSDAQAVTVGVVNMTSEAGGSVQLSEGLNEVTNTTNVPLKILDISLVGGCFILVPVFDENGVAREPIAALANGGGQFVGFCEDDPSTTVPPAGFCEISVFCEE